MKRQLIALSTALIIFASMLTGCSLDTFSFIQSSRYTAEEEQFFENYLKNNRTNIDLVNADSFSELSVIDQDIEGKEIFLTGESHGFKSNSQLEMKFLKYFKAKTNFKYLLSEDSYSNTYYINQYLKSGDEEILKTVFKETEGTFFWTKDRYEFFKKLYTYNQSLPKADQIEMVGVDIEHQWRTSFKFLNELLPENDPPKALTESIKKLESIYITTKNATDMSLVKASSQSLQDDIIQHNDAFRAYLAEDFDAFKHVNDNILNALDAYSKSDEQWNSTRDAYIYNNFKKLHTKLPKGKYYGQWGLNHIYQTKEEDTLWFAAHLNKSESEFKGKILSIAYYYTDSTVMTKVNNKQYSTDTYSEMPDAFENANRKLKGEANLYRLISTGSPYTAVGMESYNGQILKEPYTDFVQYVMCISNASPAEPLSK